MPNNSLKKQLRVLTIPVFIEIALVMMLGAVDTVMLSRYSDNSVAAVGLDNQLISLVFLVYQFFSMGAAILCAQYFGAGLGGEPAHRTIGECHAVLLRRESASSDGPAPRTDGRRFGVPATSGSILVLPSPIADLLGLT